MPDQGTSWDIFFQLFPIIKFFLLFCIFSPEKRQIDFKSLKRKFWRLLVQKGLQTTAHSNKSLISQGPSFIDLDVSNFEFGVFVVVFFRQVHLKKSNQIFDILNSTCPNRWATKGINPAITFRICFSGFVFFDSPILSTHFPTALKGKWVFILGLLTKNAL